MTCLVVITAGMRAASAILVPLLLELMQFGLGGALWGTLG